LAAGKLARRSTNEIGPEPIQMDDVVPSCAKQAEQAEGDNWEHESARGQVMHHDSQLLELLADRSASVE
jgi:hypothetical protein